MPLDELLRQIEILENRLKDRRAQQRMYGFATPDHIVSEILEIEVKISGLWAKVDSLRPASMRIKILFLASNPSDQQILCLDEEIRSIQQKIRESTYRDVLDLESMWAVRADGLQLGLLQHKPHIVHFSGHASHAGEILLTGKDRRSRPVSASTLRLLFATLKDNIRVVVLNACSTKPQAEAIAEVIDCVVGTNRNISDDAAIVFPASFYRAIGFGRSVQEAFDLARVSLMLAKIPEADALELYTRAGVDASSVRLIEPGADVRQVRAVESEADAPQDAEPGPQRPRSAPRADIDTVLLHRLMVEKFRGDGALALLCHQVQGALKNDGSEVKVGLEYVGGTTLPLQVLNLIKYLETHDLLHYLVREAGIARPDAGFDAVLG